ncbi:MAG: kynureninase [Actinoallomurus sp.]
MTTAEEAAKLDREDSLAGARDHFVLPDGMVYLDGNSLGALSVDVSARLAEVLAVWSRQLIGGFADAGWWDAPLRVGDRIGRLFGAAPGQTMAADSTSVQLFNALIAAARLRPERRTLLMDTGGFPTNRYLTASAARLLGLDVREAPLEEFDAAIRAHGRDLAVVTASAVDYRTGELWDVGGLTRTAHDVGAVTVWDLSHAAGAVPLTVDQDEVDFAVGCSYKFLSGGPGAPSFAYVARRHHDHLDQPLTGWHGHAEPFAMAPDYAPAEGIRRYRIGTPHVLSLLTLDTALDVFDKYDIELIRTKNRSLGDFFIACADAHLAGLGFEVVTPRDADRRGSQISLHHPDAERLLAELAERKVVGDLRPPNLLRFGFNGLYVSHEDILTAVLTMRSLTQ